MTNIDLPTKITEKDAKKGKKIPKELNLDLNKSLYKPLDSSFITTRFETHSVLPVWFNMTKDFQKSWDSEGNYPRPADISPLDAE